MVRRQHENADGAEAVQQRAESLSRDERWQSPTPDAKKSKKKARPEDASRPRRSAETGVGQLACQPPRLRAPLAPLAPVPALKYDWQCELVLF